MPDGDMCYEKKKKLNRIEGIESKRSHRILGPVPAVACKKST